MKKKKKGTKQTLISKTKIVQRMLLLTGAYLMEEYDWDDEKLIEYYNKIAEWSDAIDKHIISCKTVAEIINKQTGAEVRW